MTAALYNAETCNGKYITTYAHEVQDITTYGGRGISPTMPTPHISTQPLSDIFIISPHW